MHYTTLVNAVDLNLAIDAGHVRRQHHPLLPLAILNYTERCMFEKAWTPTTLACRGLIYNTNTGEVVARPFEKFFNYGQEEAGTLDLGARVEVTDKLDGSLGILYPTGGGGWAIATRGSFMSEQANHATRIFREKYQGRWAPDDQVTYLFEIIYPGNRIVCDYGDEDDLHLLGAVEIETGLTHGPSWSWSWPGPRTEVFEVKSLADALEMEPREGAEGLVVRYIDTDKRVKIKQDDYVALHRVLTGTNARVIWEFMAVNACKHLVTQAKHWGTKLHLDPERAQEILAAGPDWLDQLTEKVPDEFYDWLKATIEDIADGVGELGVELRNTAHVYAALDRKAFALAIKDNPHKGALFLLRDGRDITTYLWLAQYPEAEKPWGMRTEDVA